MHVLVLIILLLVLLYGPQLWARRVLLRYSQPRPDYPGTGGELARHLLDKFELQSVKIESTELGDHYDPQTRTVRLTTDKLDAKSLTAIAVAAHEVGHAIQHHLGYRPLRWRTGLAILAQKAEKLGSGVILVLPVVAALTHSPAAGVVMFLLGFGSMLVSTVVHLVTLPVEWDASFGRAMPLLQAGRFINSEDEKGARRILRACALTYLASSLASLLSVWRWLRLWRR